MLEHGNIPPFVSLHPYLVFHHPYPSNSLPLRVKLALGCNAPSFSLRSHAPIKAHKCPYRTHHNQTYMPWPNPC